MEKLDEFTTAYIACALWAETDGTDDQGGDPLDKNYGPEDINQECLAAMVADCEKFQHDNVDDYWACCAMTAGHDFWLTRNGHGAGFWDGDWPEPEAARLTDASKVFGEVDLYVGDDGKIYC